MPNTVHFPRSPGKRYQQRLTVLAMVKIEKSLSVFGYLWSCGRPACPPKELSPSGSSPASNLVVTQEAGTGLLCRCTWELGKSSALLSPSVCTQNNLAEKKTNRAERWKREAESRLFLESGRATRAFNMEEGIQLSFECMGS